MSDQMGGYNPPAGYNPQGGYPQQQGGYGAPQGGYPQQQGGWGQPPGYGQQPGYGAPQPSGGLKFDLQSVMPGGAIAVASAVLLFVVSFFKWWGPDVDKLCGSGDFGDTCRQLVGSAKASAWDRGVTTFAIIVALVIAVVFVLRALHVVPARFPVELIAAGLLVLADIFFLITFISQPDGASPGWAFWAGLALVVALNAGVIMALMSSGGLNTLRGGLAKMQSQQQGGYPQQPQQWGQPQQQQWSQPPPQQWGQPQQPAGWPSGGQPAAPQTAGWPSGGQPAAPQTGPPSGGQPAQPGWGQPDQPPQQGGWPQQPEPQQPGWGQQRQEEEEEQQPPQQGGWPQQQPPQQGGWPQQQPPQQGGWPQ